MRVGVGGMGLGVRSGAYLFLFQQMIVSCFDCFTDWYTYLFSGNPLGNVYIPCQAATATAPSGARTGRTARSGAGAGASTSNSASGGVSTAHYVYTFFGDAVTPTPSYTFPPPKPKSSSSLGSGTTNIPILSNQATNFGFESGTSTRVQTPTPEYINISNYSYSYSSGRGTIAPGTGSSMGMDIGIEQLQFENAISDDIAIGVDPSAQVTPGQPLRSAATASASATVSLRVPDDPTGAEYDADGVPLVGRRRGARAAAAAALRGDRTRGSRYRVNVTAGRMQMVQRSRGVGISIIARRR